MYNSAGFLPKCLDSLLNQDIPAESYEILLVNDGSPDDSQAIAEKYAAGHPNIKVFTKKNGGTSSARNVGIRNATGTYLYFVDPDDYILENSLSAILLIMDEEALDVLRFGYTEVDELGRPTQSCKHPERPDYSAKVMDGFSFMAERLGTACFVWTYLFRTSLIRENELFFDERAYIDDTPWLPRVLSCARRVDSYGVKRHFYTIRKGSLVRSGNDKAGQMIEAQKWLADELCRQKEQAADKRADAWYRMMISHSALSLLTLTGSSAYSCKKDITSWVNNREILPLSLRGVDGWTRLKLRLINLSPSGYCTLIHWLHP